MRAHTHTPPTTHHAVIQTIREHILMNAAEFYANSNMLRDNFVVHIVRKCDVRSKAASQPQFHRFFFFFLLGKLIAPKDAPSPSSGNFRCKAALARPSDAFFVH